MNPRNLQAGSHHGQQCRGPQAAWVHAAKINQPSWQDSGTSPRGTWHHHSRPRRSVARRYRGTSAEGNSRNLAPAYTNSFCRWSVSKDRIRLPIQNPASLPTLPGNRGSNAPNKGTHVGYCMPIPLHRQHTNKSSPTANSAPSANWSFNCMFTQPLL